MLASPVLSSLLHPQLKPLQPISFHHLPNSGNPILSIGFSSKRPFLGMLRVSQQKNMPELVKVDSFAGTNSGLEESEAILDNESSVLGRDLALGAFEATLNKLSKWLVAALFGLVILLKHDAEALWIAMGSILNAWISITLKKILNHERPASALRSDPGMPSSHAQSIFYTAVIALLALFEWLGVDGVTVTIGTFILMCGCYLSWLRVSQQLHTSSQVLVGAALGSACAISWFWMWHSFVLKAFIASIWVRIIVVLGSVAFCVLFLLYVIRHWVIEEQ